MILLEPALKEVETVPGCFPSKFPELVASFGHGLPLGHGSIRQGFQFHSFFYEAKKKVCVLLWGPQKERGDDSGEKGVVHSEFS
jgi:hypothetical protein